MTVYQFAYEFLSPVNHNGSNSYASYYYDEVVREIGSKYETTWAGNEKNAYTSAICSAAKVEGILIFTIGMDTDDSVADDTLEDCATLSSYFYDVQSVDISSAFSSLNSICSIPGNFALGCVEINFVWKHDAAEVIPGRIHCRSTTIASTAPVEIANS